MNTEQTSKNIFTYKLNFLQVSSIVIEINLRSNFLQITKQLKKGRTRGSNLAARKGGHGGLCALGGSVSSREISNLV